MYPHLINQGKHHWEGDYGTVKGTWSLPPTLLWAVPRHLRSPLNRVLSSLSYRPYTATSGIAFPSNLEPDRARVERVRKRPVTKCRNAKGAREMLPIPLYIAD